MTVNKNILFLPGDGIGPEVCEEAKKVLLSVNELFGLDLKVSEELVGGVAFEKPATLYLIKLLKLQNQLTQFY